MKIVAIALCLSLLGAACAAGGDSLAVDMTKPLLDEKGKPIADATQAEKDDPGCAHCPVFTVGAAISRALNTQFPDEQITGDQKWSRSVLADRIKADKHATLTLKEAQLIETVVGKAYSGLVIKQIVPLIDPNHKPPEIQ